MPDRLGPQAGNRERLVFDLISMVVLGIGLVGCVWFAFRHRQYKMLLTAAFVVCVLVYGVASYLHRQGRVDFATVTRASYVMWAGFALQYVAMYLQLRDGYRTTVAEYEARKLRDVA